jgi:hypothetical protein
MDTLFKKKALFFIKNSFRRKHGRDADSFGVNIGDDNQKLLIYVHFLHFSAFSGYRPCAGSLRRIRVPDIPFCQRPLLDESAVASSSSPNLKK